MNAFIMVRKGSERVADKNIKSFGDTNLLELKISKLKECKKIDSILVSSNCDKSLSIAKKNGCLIDERPEEHCSSEAKPKDLYRYMAWTLKNTFPEDEYFLSASVCYPFIKSKTYDDIVRIFNENYSPSLDGYSSVNYVSSLSACHLVKENLWKREREIISLDREGPIYVPTYEAMNYTPGEQPASQNLPDVCSVSFGAIITSADTLAEGDLLGKHPDFYDLSKYESLDIDDPQDFAVAEVLYKNYKEVF
tara:strand:+ start:2470 stop:3219 length:750 start_codon:yes stop_codon:yes gene_type:complete